MFLALVMALALAVPAFADGLEPVTLEESGCTYTVAPIGTARYTDGNGKVLDGYGYEEIAVFDQAVTFTPKSGDEFYRISGVESSGIPARPSLNQDGSATLPADAEGFCWFEFAGYIEDYNNAWGAWFFTACSKSFLDRKIADGANLKFFPNNDPSTPTQPAVPSTPSNTTVAKPAPGVSVPLNNAVNAYLGEYLYTIKSGDTLSKIADYYYGVPAVYELIYSYNKDILKSADRIYAGQTITLPSYAAVDLYLASAYPRESTDGGTAYIVKSGDSLSKIAKAFYGDATKWNVIYEANKGILKNPSRIYPGQVLTIPAL